MREKFNLIFGTFTIWLAVLPLSNNLLNYVEGNLVKSSLQNFPVVNDPTLSVRLQYKGLKFPTSMAFVGPNDILVLEKNDGTVNRIVNGTMLPHPLLDANVSTESERGMLGIAIAKNMTENKTYVFLSFTESPSRDAVDTTEGKQPLGNRLYRYELVNDRLINPKLLLDLPATPGPTHNGGKIAIGPDNNVYLVIGIVGTTENTKTQTQNIMDGLPPDGRGGILRITQDGNVVPNGGILGNKIPLNIYYAYGIRNSFGIAFDPLTKKLWDTENGPNFGDEINLVEPGFNSGWSKVQGIWTPVRGNAGNITLHPENLTDFGGKGKYSMPKFSWLNSTGPTALAFIDSEKLGKKYKNDIFVGDFHNGNIYRFTLDNQRTSLILHGPLKDKIADNKSELQDIIFGSRFGGITDMTVGPDGYLYVLALSQFQGGTNCDVIYGDPSRPCTQYSSSEQGSIFKIGPK